MPRPPVSLSSAAAIKLAMARTRKPSPQSGSDTLTLDYRAPNGRCFDVKEYPEGGYFLSEMRPNGRMARFNDDGRPPRFWDESRLKPLLSDPNGFIDQVRAIGLDDREIIRIGSGLDDASRLYVTLDEVAAAVAAALDANQWYEDIDHAKLADPMVQANLARREEVSSIAWADERRALHEQAVRDESGLFKGLHAVTGPLSDETKTAILSYLNAPTEEGWQAIYAKCIKGFTTVWQAWAKIDPECPASKPVDGRWRHLPDPEILRSALRTISGVDLSCDADPDPAPTPFR